MLKNLDEKVTLSNKTKHIEAEKKITDLTNKLKYRKKNRNLCFVECILQAIMVIRIF